MRFNSADLEDTDQQTERLETWAVWNRHFWGAPKCGFIRTDIYLPHSTNESKTTFLKIYLASLDKPNFPNKQIYGSSNISVTLAEGNIDILMIN